MEHEKRKMEEVERILEEAMKRITQVLTGVIPLRESSPNRKLQVLVVDILSESSDPQSVNDIAAKIGAPPASVRGILYANQDQFAKVPSGPARMRWKIRGNDNSEVQTEAHLACVSGGCL